MKKIQDIDAALFIEHASKALKKEKILEMPDWALYVKTGVSRERPPENPEWWYLRGASLLRKIYIEGPIGTEKLRTHYGGRKNYGHAPDHFEKSGAKIIRTIMQQLENGGLVAKSETKNKGRIISPKGQSFVNSILKEIA